MIYAGSVIQVADGSAEQARAHLAGVPEVTVYTTSEDGRQLIAAIEAEDDRHLEKLCADLQAQDGIELVSHLYFYFEDEVNRLEAGGGGDGPAEWLHERDRA